LNLRPPRPERGALPNRATLPLYRRRTLAPAVHAMELTPATSAPALSHAFRRKAVHSEIAVKLLTDLGANFHVFSEQALILQGNLSDFDSACRTAGAAQRFARGCDSRWRRAPRRGPSTGSVSVVRHEAGRLPTNGNRCIGAFQRGRLGSRSWRTGVTTAAPARPTQRARVHHRFGGTPWLPKQMIKALRQAIPDTLRNIPKLVAGLAAEDNEAPDHVH
jgi:hypothetical protein